MEKEKGERGRKEECRSLSKKRSNFKVLVNNIG